MVVLQATTLLKMRQSPGFTGETIGYINAGVLTYAVGGFQQADDLTWLNIAAPCQDGTWREGWAAGGQDGQAYLAGYELPGLNLDFPLAQPMPITQLFGENPAIYQQFNLLGHNGLDFGSPVGVPVTAVDAGTITHARTDPGYGNYVRIDHTWGISLYAHLDRLMVSEGDWVGRSAVIGKSGNSGGSTGPHLHFEMRVYPVNDNNGFGGRIDPLAFLPARLLLIPEHAPRKLAALIVGQ